MGICMASVNQDDDFARLNSPSTYLVNLFEGDDKEFGVKFQELVYTVFEGDVYSDVPKCACGELTRAENEGVVCPNCQRPVLRNAERDIEPILWARAPDGVAGFIQPHYWAMLTESFKVSGFDVMQWIVNSKYAPPTSSPNIKLRDVILREFGKRGIGLGWNNLVVNLVEIVTILTDLIRSGRAQHEYMRDLVIRDIQNIRCQYVPFINRSLLVLEQNPLGRYSEKSLGLVANAAMMLRGIDLPGSRKTVARREELSWKMIASLGEFYEDYYKNSFGQKSGMARKHLYSGRCRFSARSVASSITDRHNYRDIAIPWYAAVTILRPHLDNKLMLRGYTPREIERLIESHATREHPLLREIFDELLDESPGGRGIPAIIQRNPSLERGSEQLVFITRIKGDRDTTVSISIFIVRGMNCDFDGDELNYMLTLDNRMFRLLEPLAPAKSTFGLGEPGRVTGNLAAPKPYAASLTSWYENTDLDVPDPAKVNLMEAFLVA